MAIKLNGRNVLVIDGDSHVVEPPDLWSKRMDAKKWGEWIPHFDTHDMALYVGGVARAGGASFKEVAQVLKISVEEVQRRQKPVTDALSRPGGYDPLARIPDMDADAIDIAVLYPSSALFFGPLDPIDAIRDNPAFVLDCQRAYNDWLAEYCGAAPERLFGVGAVPLQDIDLACAEAERAATKLGLKGVFVRPSPYIEELPFSHPVYDRFWATCQDLGIPVVFHPGVHTDTPGACRKFRLVREHSSLAFTNMAADEVYGGSGFGQAIGNAVDMITTMGRVLMGGVCERFPTLKLIFLESGGGWCATQLERMDEQVELFTMEDRWLTLKPSEYFKRQCYIGFDVGEWNLAASAEYLGADRILWASDYPHPEYRPGVVEELQRNIASLSAADQRKIFSETAVAAYDLPVKAKAGA